MDDPRRSGSEACQMLSAGGIAVRFWRWHDRYLHSLEWDGGAANESAVILASDAGDRAAIWPNSPPLQELHVESRGPDQQVALLVGRAGASHWSVSVLADHVRQTIAFDWACRLRQPPDWLGCQYQVGASIAWRVAGEQMTLSDHRRAAVLSVAAPLRISPLSAGPHLALECPRADAADPRTEQCNPRTAQRYPRTEQWSYQLTMAPAPSPGSSR